MVHAMITLTPEQQAAVTTIDSNLQIIACAGSGKTRVVTARVIHILRTQAIAGIRPDNIVAFTFTEKAAAELKDRITQQYRTVFGHVEGLAGMYVGTIHGFCLDLLERYVARYLKFDVLDDIKQRLFIDRYYQQSGMGSLGLKRWVESGLYINILSLLRSEDINTRLLVNAPALLAARDTYQALLQQHGFLDYDEILFQAVNELQHNQALRAQISDRIKYVTIDEYQDVNPVQERLVRELHTLGANICVVGDDDQNIYQWRGSDVNHIITFANRYPAVHQISLVTNFRSSDAIIDVARRAVAVNTNRLSKKMVDAGQKPFARGDLLCLTFPSPEEEADWIAAKIQTIPGLPYQESDGQSRGLSWSDCAILLRARKTAGPIVAALRACGIPYIIKGMSNLFDMPEVTAAASIFSFMTQELTAAQFVTFWHAADLGLTDTDLQSGLALLTERCNFQPNRAYSVYSLQRTFLDFLEAINLREERIPDARGEVVYYNLGKFSQVISDYEYIHFKSDPKQKYTSFVEFLRYQAPDYYPEGGQDAGYAVPDAVQIMTIHQSKGLEFPAVFLPYLQRNRFPSRKQANRIWQYVTRQAIPNVERYEGSEEDERRLFYVAITRSEKYLFCSWAYDAGNQLYRKPSTFFDELTRHARFLTREPVMPSTLQRLSPATRRPEFNVELSFSELKYFFECPYQFKLRYLYGFNSPIDEALGYGRSLHNVLADIHRRALAGHIVTDPDIDALLATHFQTRYAYPTLQENLRRAACQALQRYVANYGDTLQHVIHTEENIEMSLPGGVLVHGRVDLIKRTDTNETMIVDFKSTQRAQAEEITRLQLHVYALGYEQRYGQRADLIEVHNLDQGGSIRELVDISLITNTVTAVSTAGANIRDNQLPRLQIWCTTCDTCDFSAVCRSNKVVPPSVAYNGTQHAPLTLTE